MTNGPRFTKRVRRGLSSIAAHCDAGSIPEDILGLPEDCPELETPAGKRKIEDIELALRWIWAHSESSD